MLKRWIFFASHMLGMIAAVKSSNRLSRIAIVGAGPCGLATALCLSKSLPPGWKGRIDVFDGRKDMTQSQLGGGLQISGATLVLEYLGLFGQFKKIALPIERIWSRTSSLEPLFDLNIPKTTQKAKFNELLDSEGNPRFYSILRDSLINLLLQATRNEKSRITLRPGSR